VPGLVGIVSINGDKVNLGLMKAMRDAIRHRDWYEVDDYVNTQGTAAISRVHLGIINKDKQPFSARNGKVQVFLHGEIYNDEVADSNPLEFIYRLYEKEGLNFASFLNGSFIVVIVDEKKDVVLIANDRIAAKPLFHFDDGRAIYFGPEMKSLFLASSLKRELNLAAVADFLANGQFTREHTLIEGLETVGNATVLKITADGVVPHRYWKYDLERGGKDHSQGYYQKRLAELLRQAVRRRLRTDGTYGILLSGGYDARGILGCYLEERNDGKLYTISWGREEDIPSSDCAIAKRLAQKLGADHRFYKLTAEEVVNSFRDFVLLGEGLTWYPESYDIFHRIREQQGVDIVLRGDECFGWHGLLVHDEHTMFRSLTLRALRNIKSYQRILKPFYYQSFCELDAETTRRISSRCTAQNIHNRKDFFYLDIRLRYFINPLNYVKNFAMESFTPLLDYDILAFVSTLPVKHRLDKNLYRKTIVEMFPELFEEIAQRRNDIDWAASFKSSPDLQRFVYRELIEKQNLFSEFIDTDSLKNELDAFFSAPPNPPGSHGLKTKMKANAFRLLEKSPAAYNFVHKSSYYVRKRLGKSRDILPTEHLIIRLLILKVWVDVFLSYPVVNTSK
jgi:asparagine synthase (glutamine-hydrolysing)